MATKADYKDPTTPNPSEPRGPVDAGDADAGSPPLVDEDGNPIIPTPSGDGDQYTDNGPNPADPPTTTPPPQQTPPPRYTGFSMPGAPGVGDIGDAGTDPTAPQVDLGIGSEYTATTREVQDNELVSHHLNALLKGDSKYMQQARAEGLAAANARGGLGGSAQAFASMSAAIQAGLPVAQADAQAFRDAAAQNMNALNQFGLANMQRVSQLAMANLDSATRVQTTAMNNASQQSIARLQAMTQLQNTALQGEIQARLAEQQFMINQVLNYEQHGYRMEQIGFEGEYRLADTEMRGEYNLAQTDLQGQYNLAGVDRQGEWNYYTNRETNYTNLVTGAMQTYFNRLDNLNGLEMDDAARQRAQEQYYNDYISQMNLYNSLFPDIPPISMIPAPGSEGG